MKKSFKLFTLVFALMFAIVVKVNATDLTSKITLNDGLGGLVTFDKWYNQANDVTEVTASITLDQAVIDTILDQKSGSGSTLSMFYITLDPNLGLTSIYKQNNWYEVGSGKSVDEIKAELRNKITDSDVSTYDEVWPIGLMVQYYDETDQSWKRSDTAGTGSLTIRQDLINKLGLDSADELEYGVNYRISMYDSYEWYYIWTDSKDAAAATVEEFVSIGFEVNFPVTTTDGEEYIYHLTLEDALENGYNHIVIKDDITINDDVVILEGKYLEIEENVTVTLNDAEIKTEGGYVLSSGKVVDGDIEYYNVLVVLKDGEDIFADAYLVAKGDKVAIPTIEGYKVTDVRVYNADDEEITVTDGSFVMPGEVVAIEGTLVKEVEQEVPNTLDNVTFFVIFGLISLIGVAVAINKLRKNA